MTTIKTNERTLNKTVKAQIAQEIKGIKKVSKKHVAGVGYVTYFKNDKGAILGKVFRDNQGMTIYVN